MASRLIKNSPGEKRTLLWAALAGVLALALDVITKFWVVNDFELYESRVVIPDLLAFTSVRNLGAAWSILSGYGWLLLVVACIMSAVIVIKFRKIAEGCAERYYALILLLAGIIGNAIDRGFRGAVVDFIHVHWKNVWHYPVFNVADVAICCSVGIIVLSVMLRKEIKAGNPQKEEQK